MQRTASVLGVVAATAGMMAAGSSAAFADDEGSDGVTILNNSNIHVLPVQLCNNNIAVAGGVLPIGSPQDASCTNTPMGDHPQQGADEEPPTDGREEPQVPDVPQPEVPDVPQPEVPDVPQPEVPDVPDVPQPQVPDQPEDPQTDSPAPAGQGGGPEKDVPSAPAPTVMKGHLPVTG